MALIAKVSVAFALLLGGLCVPAHAEILHCFAKLVADYPRQLKVDIVLPADADYDKELAMVDARSGEVTQTAVTEIFGHHERKAIGTMEISTDPNGSGKFNKPKRVTLIVTVKPVPGQFDLMGIYIGEDGAETAFPGLVVVDYQTGKKTITLSDAWHRGIVLSFYQGTCE